MSQEVLMVLLAIVLLQTFYVTIKKARELWAKETEKKNKLEQELIEKRERKKLLKLSRTAHSIIRQPDR